MQETRKRFHDELAALESEVLGLGERAEHALAWGGAITLLVGVLLLSITARILSNRVRRRAG